MSKTDILVKLLQDKVTELNSKLNVVELENIQLKVENVSREETSALNEEIGRLKTQLQEKTEALEYKDRQLQTKEKEISLMRDLFYKQSEKYRKLEEKNGQIMLRSCELQAMQPKVSVKRLTPEDLSTSARDPPLALKLEPATSPDHRHRCFEGNIIRTTTSSSVSEAVSHIPLDVDASITTTPQQPTTTTNAVSRFNPTMLFTQENGPKEQMSQRCLNCNDMCTDHSSSSLCKKCLEWKHQRCVSYHVSKTLIESLDQC